MRFEVGSQFAGYTIASRLGRGGMATVYLVREPGIERQVALKVLPERVSEDPQFAARFELEARVIGSLDHPNIIPLYRYGITDDVAWMALRYVDGGDLAHRLTSQPLSVPEGLAILKGVAAALDYAHRKGVVHRDLKPQNILLTSEGAAYLADFGVAKMLEGSGSLKTLTGNVMGTPAYMAPEQAQGLPLGPCTDVYALAVICFEWLTGRLPFDADSPHAILMKHVIEPVPSEALRVLSSPVADVLLRGLAKFPDHRIQTAGALIDQLDRALQASAVDATSLIPAVAAGAPEGDRATARRVQADIVTARSKSPGAGELPKSADSPVAAGMGRRKAIAIALSVVVACIAAWGIYRVAANGNGPSGEGTMQAATSGTIPDKSIAVLPLVNESGDNGQQYFSDGLSEELITALSQFQQIKVISRDSSFRFRGAKQSSAEIGRALVVAYLLEGSVQRSDTQLRIRVELVRAADGSTIWSQRYDRPNKDLFAIQDEISSAVAGALKTKLLEGEQATASKQSDRPPSGNLAAYDAYQEGNFAFAQASKDSLHRAIAAYQKAIQADPQYAAAHARLSMAWTQLGGTSLAGSELAQALAHAQEASDQALRIDPGLAEAHVARGFLLSWAMLKWRDAEPEFRKAIELDPNNRDAQRMLADNLATLGRADEAVRMYAKLLRTNPYDGGTYAGIAYLYGGLWRLDEAEAAIRKAISLQPDGVANHANLAVILVQRGDGKAAVQAAKDEATEGDRVWALALAYAAAGDSANADAMLKDFIARFADTYAYNVAEVYAYRKQPDEAFAWLDRALANRDGGIQYLLFDAFLLKYKDDPRFAAFCTRAGLPTPVEVAAQVAASPARDASQ